MAEPNNESKNEIKAESKSELPIVESPSIAPDNEPAPVKIEAAAAEPIKIETVVSPESVKPEPAKAEAATLPLYYRLLAIIPPINLRGALTAATVVLAAGLGALVGTQAGKDYAALPLNNVQVAQDNVTLEQSIARLSKELATLKTSIDTANKESRTQISKLNDRLAAEQADITGSISKPATIAPQALTPIPAPRPVIVQGWSAHEGRDGTVLVSNRGELYQVAPGVPLPGLGPVEVIRREGGRVTVVTAKGIITAAQPTAAARPRVYFPPYYRPY